MIETQTKKSNGSLTSTIDLTSSTNWNCNYFEDPFFFALRVATIFIKIKMFCKSVLLCVYVKFKAMR